MGADAGVDVNSVSATSLVGGDVVVAYASYVYKLDAITGTALWRTAPTVSQMLASPSISGAAGDQVVFEGDLSGYEYGFRLSDGTQLYQHKFGTNARILSSTAVSAGRAYLATTNPGKIFAIG